MLRSHGRSRVIAFGLLGVVLSVLPLFATQSIGKNYHAIPPNAVYPLEEGAWHEAPPGLPPGGTFAVVSGDPLEPGPFVVRVRLPPGYVLPPYRRRNEEQLIVLAGAITMGTSGEPASLQVEQLSRDTAGAGAGTRSLQTGKVGVGCASVALAGNPAGRGKNGWNAEFRRLAS